MHKRLITVFMAMAVFAVVPSVASAIELRDGSEQSADTKIRAHNVGDFYMTTSAGTFVCTTAEITGHLTQNGPTAISGDIQAASFKGTASENRCASPLGPTKVTFPSLPWCVRTLDGTDSFEIRGGNCPEASRPLTIIFDIGANPSLVCQYQRANLTGSFPTSPEDAILSINEVEFAKEGGSFLCPGSTKFDASLTLENDTEGTNPLYFNP